MFAHGVKRKFFEWGTHGYFQSKNSGISRGNYYVINRKHNCENKVSSRKSTILKTASSEKIALAKTYITVLKKARILKK